MALYDRFSDVMKDHGDFVHSMEKKRQERILDWIVPFLKTKDEVRALEVGVGIGLFAVGCRQRGWSYVGVDRNKKMVSELGGDFSVLEGEVPPLPEMVELGSFDLAYSAFVLEHLADGVQGYEFACEMNRALKPEEF
jgi:ubiquinone/menaquinone biosynthesis C-methylase UbiE